MDFSLKKVHILRRPRLNRFFAVTFTIMTAAIFMASINQPDPFNTGFWVGFFLMVIAFGGLFAWRTTHVILIITFDVVITILITALIIQMALQLNDVLSYTIIYLLIIAGIELVFQSAFMLLRLPYFSKYNFAPKKPKPLKYSFHKSKSTTASYAASSQGTEAPDTIYTISESLHKSSLSSVPQVAVINEQAHRSKFNFKFWKKKNKLVNIYKDDTSEVKSSRSNVLTDSSMQKSRKKLSESTRSSPPQKSTSEPKQKRASSASMSGSTGEREGASLSPKAPWKAPKEVNQNEKLSSSATNLAGQKSLVEEKPKKTLSDSSLSVEHKKTLKEAQGKSVHNKRKISKVFGGLKSNIKSEKAVAGKTMLKSSDKAEPKTDITKNVIDLTVPKSSDEPEPTIKPTKKARSSSVPKSPKQADPKTKPPKRSPSSTVSKSSDIPEPKKTSPIKDTGATASKSSDQVPVVRRKPPPIPK